MLTTVGWVTKQQAMEGMNAREAARGPLRATTNVPFGIQRPATMQSAGGAPVHDWFELYSVDLSTISIRSRVWLRLGMVRTGSRGTKT